MHKNTIVDFNSIFLMCIQEPSREEGVKVCIQYACTYAHMVPLKCNITIIHTRKLQVVYKKTLIKVAWHLSLLQVFGLQETE